MRKLTILLISIISLGAQAQIGGTTAFTFALIENNAQQTALGGVSIANGGFDPSYGFQNPGLINPSMHNQISLSYANHVADLNHGFLSYGFDWDSVGTFVVSSAYFDYGEFVRTNNAGDVLGAFRAADYTFQIGYSRPLTEKITYGANTKFLYSAYESYVSTAAAIDLGVAYMDSSKLLSGGFLIKNMGMQLLRYSDNSPREPLPFDIQASVSKKLEHNPLRFTLALHNLHRWNNSYVNVNARNKEIDLETGELKNQSLNFGQKMMRHVVFNTELFFGEKFIIRGGYNGQRRAELGPENRRAMTGFSWGVSVGIKKFYLTYANAGYFPGIGTNYFSVSRDLTGFKKD